MIAAAGRARGAVVNLQEYWATLLYFGAFEHGVDVEIEGVRVG